MAGWVEQKRRRVVLYLLDQMFSEVCFGLYEEKPGWEKPDLSC